MTQSPRIFPGAFCVQSNTGKDCCTVMNDAERVLTLCIGVVFDNGSVLILDGFQNSQ